MLDKVSANGTRMVAIIIPPPFQEHANLTAADAERLNAKMRDFFQPVTALSQSLKIPMVSVAMDVKSGTASTRNGIHLDHLGHRNWGNQVGSYLLNPASAPSKSPKTEILRKLIQSKNRLWFHYTRPQNCAFLGGDRDTQPSSYDHIKTSDRWFPKEMEAFLPMIEEKEKQIWQAHSR